MISVRSIIIICTISVLCLLNLRAQDTLFVDPAKIDSLALLLTEHENEDIEKVRLLNEYARLNFFNKNLIEGFKATIEASNLSKEIGYEEGQILYHETLAAFLGDGDMVSYHHQKARMLFTKLSKSDSFAEVQVPPGYPLPFSDSYQKKMIEALEYFSDVDNKEILANINGQLASYYFNNGKEVELESTLRKTIKIYEELGELYPIFLFYSYKTFLATRQGDNEELKRIESEIQKLAGSIQDNNETGLLNFILAFYYIRKEQLTLAVEHYLKCIDFFESIEDHYMLADVYSEMSNIYSNLEMFSKSAEAMENRINVIESHKLNVSLYNAYNRAMWIMYDAKNYSRALFYKDKKEELVTDTNREDFLADSYSLEGHILLDQKKYEDAIPFLEKALQLSLKLNRNQSDEWEAYRLADCYYHINSYEEGLKYALQSKELLNPENSRLKRNLSLLLSEIYHALDRKNEAYEQLKFYTDLINDSKEEDIANLIMQTEVRAVLDKKEKEIDVLEQEQYVKEQENKAQRLWIISIAGALLSALLVSLILYRNNKNRQKANEILLKQKEKVQDTLTELKATQSQLIQSEKMASLGELTAGIAHEIQNPLNFVKNFSEVSTELIDEMLVELKANKTEDAMEIATDIKENQERINHHGKRAGSIVKGMLQHSRTSSGELVETDINNLCDEYLRLSYHGLRAKDKSFNADLKTALAKDLPKVKVVPQDFGRVLLNLINNAFYAVKEKSESGIDNFKPTVEVSTKLLKNKVEIKVSDNGNGVPEAVKKKIFQPFFTTKPSGKGTGLGLSLSYDIVKAHGGELKVETKPSRGTDFIITLPV